MSKKTRLPYSGSSMFAVIISYKIRTEMIKQLVLVALGGGAGSVMRYLISLWTMKHLSCSFPLGTFIVNMTGCFIIGLLIGLSSRYDTIDNDLRLLLIVGFCGGYTTFSTFSAENIRLFETGNYWMLALYITASVTVGFAAILAGNLISKTGMQ